MHGVHETHSAARCSRKWPGWFVCLATLIGALTITLLTPGCSAGKAPDSTSPDILNAAIIDQLHNYQPNPYFIRELTDRLVAQGFAVDLYSGDEVTLNLYRKLPTYGYEIVVFRAHAGLLDLGGDTGDMENTDTYLFTAEQYSINEEVWGQLLDQIAPAEVMEGQPRVFAVNSDFIRKSIEGEFDDCVVIMMGCSTAYSSDMAEAFISKGASLYIGWSASVHLDYVDEATLSMMDELIVKEVPVEAALRDTVAEIGLDQEYKAYPRYYPSGVGAQTIYRLINN